MQTLTPKNWGAFQHYKDRSPAWIKLHRGMLDDYDYHGLPDASKALAPMLWLLASEYEGGQIPFDLEKIAFRMRMLKEKLASSLKPLIDKGFFSLSQDASEVLAECLPRERGEKEKEKEGEKKGAGALTVSDLVSDGVFETEAEDYIRLRKRKKAPLTQRAWDAMKREAVICQWSMQNVVVKCLEKDWRSFEAAWVMKAHAAADKQAHNKAFMDVLTGRTDSYDANDPFTIDAQATRIA